jgi:hypothetical protein
MPFVQGELEHRRVKRYFIRSSKNKFEKQITNHERRERLLRLYNRHNARVQRAKSAAANKKDLNGIGQHSNVDIIDEERLPYTQPRDHHQMSDNKKRWIHMPTWASENTGSASMEVSSPAVSFKLFLTTGYPRPFNPTSRTTSLREY